MSNSNEVWEWLRFAKMDLETAEHLFKTMLPKPFEIICYHSQQAAEKALKSFLIFKDEDLIKTHDLALLCDKCIQYDNEFEGLYDLCVNLTVYGIQPRYPYEIEIFENDVVIALRNANDVYRTVENIIKQYLSN